MANGLSASHTEGYCIVVWLHRLDSHTSDFAGSSGPCHGFLEYANANLYNRAAVVYVVTVVSCRVLPSIGKSCPRTSVSTSVLVFVAPPMNPMNRETAYIRFWKTVRVPPYRPRIRPPVIERVEP